MKKLLLVTNQINKNLRIYPKEVVEAAIQDPIIQEQLALKCFFGVSDLSTSDNMLIDVSKITHSIENMYFEGDELYGEVVLLDTIEGRLVKEILSTGGKMELCLYGVGDCYYDAEKNASVVSKLEIISFNWASESSNIRKSSI